MNRFTSAFVELDIMVEDSNQNCRIAFNLYKSSPVDIFVEAVPTFSGNSANNLYCVNLSSKIYLYNDYTIDSFYVDKKNMEKLSVAILRHANQLKEVVKNTGKL